MGNYIEKFRDENILKNMVKELTSLTAKGITIMEVCGTHTMAISKYGIKDLLPKNISLVSGPGCPVCVTPISFINAALALSKNNNVIITTFGDMMRVPGSNSNLQKEKSCGADIRIVYSPLDSLKIARENTEKEIVFISVGFETTTPVAALSILKAKEEKIENFSCLTANKTIPEVLRILAEDKEIGIDGYLYPGHVSAIIGTKAYKKLEQNNGISGIVTGFEPSEILYAIISLIKNINSGNKIFENQYKRVVKDEGNILAKEKTDEVFEPCSSTWRGLGNIPKSGLRIKDKYKDFDAKKKFQIEFIEGSEPSGCLCAEILKGKKLPYECPMFKKVCTPINPVGACMVSSEGSCAAWYKYRMTNDG